MENSLGNFYALLALALLFLISIAHRWATAYNLYNYRESHKLKKLKHISFFSTRETVITMLALFVLLFLHVIKEVSTWQAAWLGTSIVLWATISFFFVRWNAAHLLNGL